MNSEFKSLAMDRCHKFKHTLTPQRMTVIDGLLEQPGPISAYELQEYLSENGKNLNIATIYRILDFWGRLSLVHRINSINKFVSCSAPNEQHTHILNYCLNCEAILESCHEKMGVDIAGGAEYLGLTFANNIHLEIPVICATCG